MTQGTRRLADRLLDQLMDAGDSWTARAELAMRQDCSAVALDDALADLVIEGKAVWRANVGYRLAATTLCRRALRQLRVERHKDERIRAAIVAAPLQDGYHVGVAEIRNDTGLVLYELQLPPAAAGEDALQQLEKQVHAICHFTETRGVS